jgi:Transposase IS116/IS110/IS902 family
MAAAPIDRPAAMLAAAASVNPDIAGSSRQSLGSVANVTGAAPAGFYRLAVGVQVGALRVSPHPFSPIAEAMQLERRAPTRHLLECGLLQLGIDQQPFEGGVLTFEVLEPFGVLSLQAAKLAAPAVIRRPRRPVAGHPPHLLILLTGYQAPDGLRRLGAARLERWLRDRGAYNASDIATRAIQAATAQRTTVIGQDVAASVVTRLAQNVLDLNAELVEVDAMIEAKFRQHRLAGIIAGMPGFGHLLGAELLAATNGDLTRFNTADRLAGVAGLAPVPRDSGRISGNLKRPRRYDRRLLESST